MEVREKKEESESPPTDDCCSICFGSFIYPCRSNCGHWFCANCILQYWHHGAALQPCRCPMCTRRICQLTLDVSLNHHQEPEVAEVLKSVQRYNRVFVGGTAGFIQRVRESPLFIKRIFREMMDPDRSHSHMYKVRMLAMLLSVLYTASPFDFIPSGRVGIVRLFDYCAIALVLTLHWIGVYRARRRAQRVRNLASSQHLEA